MDSGQVEWAVPYTPGYSDNATAFMARRSLDVHGAFVIPLLREDMAVLDLGCGPGTVTVDLARRLPRGRILGLDREESQIGRAREAAAIACLANVEFTVGDASCLALQPASFDLVFAHALFEHLPDPMQALRQIKASLRPGGHIALRSPDWGGFLLYPETTACREAMAAYESLQSRNGGDTHAGRKLAAWLSEAGFSRPRLSASFEIYSSASMIADYLARQLEAAGEGRDAKNLREWAQAPHAVFAQSWFEAIAQKT
jgi:ubiquinone/menaquinone biosynthesis C-methylase UbiE